MKTLTLTKAEPISDQERIDEAAAWLPFIPDEIRWMFEEAIAVANRLLSAQSPAQS